MGDDNEEPTPAVGPRPPRWPRIAGLAAFVLVVVLATVLAAQSVDRRISRATRQRVAVQSIDGSLLVARADLDGQHQTLSEAEKTLRAATAERDEQAAAVERAERRLRSTKDALAETRAELKASAKRLKQTQRCLVRAAQVLNQVAVNDFFGLANTTPKFKQACDPVLKR